MGNPANARLLYGLAWGPDEAPAIWGGEDGFMPESVADFTRVPPEHLPEPGEEVRLCETLECVLTELGLWSHLEVVWHGDPEVRAGAAVTLKSKAAQVGAGYIKDVSGRMQDPTSQELAALYRLADYLGESSDRIGWKLLAYYC